MKTVRNRTFKTPVPSNHEVVTSGPCGVTESHNTYAMEPARTQLCGNVNERNPNWLQLGSHWIGLEELQAKAALKRAIEKGKSGMNSAHVLHVFSKFEDQDWDRALVIWWHALAALCVLGGAISAAVWA